MTNPFEDEPYLALPHSVNKGWRHVAKLQDVTPAILRAVFLAVWGTASNGNGDGACWKSIPTLAREACVSINSTKRALRSLVSIGVLRKEPGSVNNDTATYRVNLETLAEIIANGVDEPGHTGPTPQATQASPPGHTGLPPRPHRPPKKNPVRRTH
jgi:hypothetical protein